MPVAMIDGRLLDSAQASISVLDDGLLRGDGVFEVVRLYRGRPWALGEHLDRMGLSARNLRLSLPRPQLEEELRGFLAQVGEIEAFLRIVATRGGKRLALIEPIHPGPGSIALATVEYMPSSLLRETKSLSYAANMLAARLAVEQGADDALLVADDETVLEASRASFFYVMHDELFTPPLQTGILDSITRRHLLSITDARERPTVCGEFADISEAFVASTTKEVLPVRAIDEYRFQGVPGPHSESAKRVLFAQIQAALGIVFGESR